MHVPNRLDHSFMLWTDLGKCTYNRVLYMLTLFARTNVPLSSARTWTPFHHPRNMFPNKSTKKPVFSRKLELEFVRENLYKKRSKLNFESQILRWNTLVVNESHSKAKSALWLRLQNIIYGGKKNSCILKYKKSRAAMINNHLIVVIILFQ